jgi:hypothetical protein
VLRKRLAHKRLRSDANLAQILICTRAFAAVGVHPDYFRESFVFGRKFFVGGRAHSDTARAAPFRRNIARAEKSGQKYFRLHFSAGWLPPGCVASVSGWFCLRNFSVPAGFKEKQGGGKWDRSQGFENFPHRIRSCWKKRGMGG